MTDPGTPVRYLVSGAEPWLSEFQASAAHLGEWIGGTPESWMTVPERNRAAFLAVGRTLTGLRGGNAVEYWPADSGTPTLSSRLRWISPLSPLSLIRSVRYMATGRRPWCARCRRHRAVEEILFGHRHDPPPRGACSCP